jgi:hypothetical protein
MYNRKIWHTSTGASNKIHFDFTKKNFYGPVKPPTGAGGNSKTVEKLKYIHVRVRMFMHLHINLAKFFLMLNEIDIHFKVPRLNM